MAMSPRFLTTLVAVTLLLAGCGSDHDGISDTRTVAERASDTPGIVAEQVGSAIQVRNTHGTPIEAVLVEQRFLDSALASFCFGSPGCGTVVAAGGAARLALTGASGYEPAATTYVVVWWPVSTARTTDISRISVVVR